MYLMKTGEEKVALDDIYETSNIRKKHFINRENLSCFFLILSQEKEVSAYEIILFFNGDKNARYTHSLSLTHHMSLIRIHTHAHSDTFDFRYRN